jgi:predicted DCC family thiol-disulfide oxidoreductase YuxK
MPGRLREALGRPIDPRRLALTRIGVGVAAGMIGLETWRLLIKVSAPDKLQVPALAWLPVLSHELIWALFAVWTLLAAALTLGLKARLAAAGLALLAVLAMLLDEQVYSNHLALMAVLCGLLALGRPAAVWSLDARRRPPVAATPYWPVFLIQVQISTLYGFAALSKLNDVYFSGEVLERSTWGFVNTLGEPLLIAAALAGIAVELFLSVGLWNARLQRIAFPLGLCFHLLIVATFERPLPLIPFALLALSPYVLFLRAKPASRVVIWDDGCAFCARSVALLRGIDLLGVHRFVGSSDPSAFEGTGVTPLQAERAVQLVVDGHRVEGYDAIRMALEVSPPTFLLAPLLGIPPIARLGRRAYRRVAARRACRLTPVRAA